MCVSPCSCKTVQCASYQGRLSSSNFLILKGWTSCKSLQLTLTSDHKQRAIVLSNCILYWQSRNLSLTPQSHATSPFKAEWKATLGVWKRKMGQLQREMALDLFSHDFFLFSMIFGSFMFFCRKLSRVWNCEGEGGGRGLSREMLLGSVFHSGTVALVRSWSN